MGAPAVLDETTLPATPIGEMLADMVRSSPLANLTVGVRRCVLPGKGDWSVDLDPSVDNATCLEAAGRLAALPGVLRALPIRPRIFLTLSAPLLAGAVVRRIEKDGERYGDSTAGHGASTLLMFSSPNGNKPLHLGHFRNNALGMALGNMLESYGYTVTRASVLSDWGIHMTQALAGYLRWGQGETPNDKPDHFVGEMYVRYRREVDRERARMGATEGTPFEREAYDLLARLEKGDPELEALNHRLGDWADDGIQETYARIGSRFDHIFRERETLPLAKQLVLEALDAGLCARRDDGSVYVDLTEDGLGEITLLRSDGTAVVYAHMLANNVHRRSIVSFDAAMSVYGEQWKTGTDVMTTMLRRFGYEWADRQERIHHGMVTLGKTTMSSRRGHVVTADALIDQVRDRLRSMDIGLGDDDCELAAVAFLKNTLLSVPRLKPIAYDEQMLWRREFPRFGRMVRAAAIVRRRALGADGENVLEDDPAVRNLLLTLDAFPLTAASALREREPHVIVRWLETVCQQARAAPNGDSSVWRATDVAVTKALALLELHLPESILNTQSRT